jgi:hypothetical protein
LGDGSVLKKLLREIEMRVMGVDFEPDVFVLETVAEKPRAKRKPQPSPLGVKTRAASHPLVLP